MKYVLMFLCLALAERSYAINDIHPTSGHISYEDRVKNKLHKGGVFWLTGLSGSGKSTIAYGAEKQLFDQGANVIVLDGDTLRNGLNNNLGFSEEDRKENIRRAFEVARILEKTGFIVICSFISPYETDREMVKQNALNGSEIYVESDLNTVIHRDPKGLYKKALNGDIKNFTGVSAPYEIPKNPDFKINTENSPIEDSVKLLVNFIKLKSDFGDHQTKQSPKAISPHIAR